MRKGHNVAQLCIVRNLSYKVWSPGIFFTNGVWSVTTSRSLHPCVKYLDSSSPQLGHNVAQLCIVRNLIYKAKPAANVRGRSWCRKVADGVRVFWQGLDGFFRYAEPCEVNNYLREIEFICVQNDSCLAYTDEKVNGSPPVRLMVGVTVNGVSHTTFLSLKVR